MVVGKAGVVVGKAGMAVGQVAVQGAVNLGKAAASSLPVGQDDDRFAKRTGRSRPPRDEDDEDEDQEDAASGGQSDGLPRRPQRPTTRQSARYSDAGPNGREQEGGDGEEEDESRDSAGTQNVLTKGIGLMARGALQAVTKVGGVAADGFNAATGGLKKLTTASGTDNGGDEDREDDDGQSTHRSSRPAMDRAGSQGSSRDRAGTRMNGYRRPASRHQAMEEEEEEESGEEIMTAKQRWLAQQRRKNAR
jgi:hypothetical protein